MTRPAPPSATKKGPPRSETHTGPRCLSQDSEGEVDLGGASTEQPDGTGTEGKPDDDAATTTFNRVMYIHLRDATVFAPGAQPTLAKTLWRGRLSHVSGWSLGQLSS
jgi:hypothetical protein